jgi:hypothetical protein
MLHCGCRAACTAMQLSLPTGWMPGLPMWQFNCLIHTWDTHGTHMGHTWDTHGTHMGHTWDTHGTPPIVRQFNCLIHTWDTTNRDRCTAKAPAAARGNPQGLNRACRDGRLCCCCCCVLGVRSAVQHPLTLLLLIKAAAIYCGCSTATCAQHSSRSDEPHQAPDTPE